LKIFWAKSVTNTKLFNNIVLQIQKINHMKKLITVFLIAICISFQGFSQISTAAPADIASLKKNKIYVVLQGGIETKTNVKYSKVEGENETETSNKNSAKTANEDTEYNKAIRFAMTNFWKASKVEYISESDFEQKRLENNAYFISPMKYKTLDKEPVTLNILAVTKGGPKYKKADKMPILAGVPLGYFNVNEANYVYKIPAFVQFLQIHMDYVFQNSPVDQKKMLNHYNSKTRDMKDGTLYVVNEDLTAKVNDIDVIGKYYKGDVMIVEPTEIEQAIKSQDSHVVFAHVVGPQKAEGFCRKYIFAAKGGELLFMSEHNVSKSSPEGLLESDFKQMNK
jgi:hypothetical protein